MTRSVARHAIIIGGGASGVLLAYQLLQKQDSDFCVTLIEKRSEIGRGLAYHTGNPDHLLNVRAANMSALPDDPELAEAPTQVLEVGAPGLAASGRGGFCMRSSRFLISFSLNFWYVSPVVDSLHCCFTETNWS